MAKGAYVGVSTQMPGIGSLNVGDTVKLNVNGVATEFIVVHQGNPDSSIYDASCDGTWLLMNEPYTTHVWASSKGDYDNSDLHEYLNSNFFGLFDASVQSAIKQVKIPYNVGTGSSGTVYSGANGLSCRVFSLSSEEVGGLGSTAISEEGAKLDFFDSGTGTDAKAKRIFYDGSTAIRWWTRSEYSTTDNSIVAIETTGTYISLSYSSPVNIRPAIILPSTLGVTDGLITGATAGYQDVARKIKKGYIGIGDPVRHVPTGYTQINYLASSKYQYIDTGFIPNQDTRVVMSMTINGGDGSARCLFGARSSASVNEYSLWITAQSTTDVTSGYDTERVTSTHSSVITGKHVFDKNKNALYIDGVLINAHTATTFSAGYPLYLLDCNTAGSQALLQCDGYLHYCKIYDNDTLVRDFVPCTNSAGVAGLYDMVNGVFYTNAANNDKTFGSGGVYTDNSVARKIKKAYIGIGGGVTYREVEYIQSSGTQYIDTGFKPKFNTRVVMDASNIPATSNYVFGARNANSQTADQQFGFFRNSATTIRSDYFGTSVTANVSDTTGRTTIDMNGNVTTAFGATITNTAVSSGECTYPLYLFAVNTLGSATVFGTARVYSCKIYDAGVLVRDFVPVINPNGTPGLFDKVSCHFFANSGTGAFVVGAETGAKFISKGIARPCWSGGEPEYYGTITPLSVARSTLTAITLGDHALFAGGRSGSTMRKTVDAYDKSLTRTTPTELGTARMNLAAATVGGYILFAGGNDSTTSGDDTNAIDAYDESLTRTAPSTISTARASLAGATVGDHALFAGGYTSSSAMTTKVDAYDTQLTRTIPTALSCNRYDFTAVSNGEYAIFPGGAEDTIDVYDSELTMTTLSAQLHKAIRHFAATVIDGVSLVAGGVSSNNTTAYAVVTAITKDLTLMSAPDMSVARRWFAATTIGDNAIFAGGLGESASDILAIVESYDPDLTKTARTDLSVVRRQLAAASIGNHALFAGGQIDTATSDVTDVVDAYVV